jgi:heme exporter protein C
MMSLWEYANPVKFFALSGRILPWVSGFSAACLLIGLYWGFFHTPDDYRMGSTVKIIYIHVPSALMAINAWFMMLVASLIWLIRRHHVSALAAKAAAPVGVVMTLIALITGAIWGQPMWGTWWAWDARITSMLILALFYALYLISWRIYENEEKVFKISTFITILGIINVPIIKYSVDWWNTLHQPASINILSKSSIHSSMLYPLLIMTAAFALFSLLIFLMKYNTELIKIKNKGLDRL